MGLLRVDLLACARRNLSELSEDEYRYSIHATEPPTFLEIMKGAFQLVELITLLFLKTTWIHCVCSYNIRQLRVQSTNAKDYKEEHTLKDRGTRVILGGHFREGHS
jgi:hypothetical protein